jgi:hypothetical protein
VIERHLYLPNPEAKSRFRELEKATCIGWDFDETLYGHHNSPRIHHFIRQHPEIRHLIVTFRGSHSRVLLERDLSYYRTAPPISAFAEVINISDELYSDNIRYLTLLNNNLQVSNKDVRNFLQEYNCWKGDKCAEHGAEFLVDDMHDRVQLGCAKNNITLIHPDEL